MKGPTYITGDYSKSSHFKGESRLICHINDSDTRDADEVSGNLLYALEHGVTAFHVDSPAGKGAGRLSSALKHWGAGMPSVSTGISIDISGTRHGLTICGAISIFRNDIIECIDMLNIGRLNTIIIDEQHLSQSGGFDDIYSTIIDLREKKIVDRAGLKCFRPVDYAAIIQSSDFDILWGYNRLNACNIDAINTDLQFVKDRGMGYYNSSLLHMSLLGDRLGQYSRERPGTELISDRDVDIAVMASRLASRSSMTITEMALRYAFSIAEADRLVISADNHVEMKKAIECWHKGPLDEELFNDITRNTMNYYPK